MGSSFEILFVVFLFVVPRPAVAFVAASSAKLELVNVSLDHLEPSYLRRFDPDLAYLKISGSKIGKMDENAFGSLVHLNLLEISDCEIASEIPPRTFFGLPGLEILVLKNLGLRRANLTLTHVQEVTLSGNELESLGGIAGGDVNYLDVSNNKLRALRESFEGLRKLSMIDVSKNKISDVGDVFSKNPNLLRILASENRIHSTGGLRLPWLKTLDLFDNKISVLDAESFAKMSALEELVLAFNGIRRLEDPFGDLLELKFLNLAWNHIEEVEPDLFRNNLYLNSLSLQGNKLKELVPFVGELPHLTQLDLSHNEISLLSDEFFVSMPSIQVLDLSFNRLKVVADALSPLADLRVLDLAYNGIVLSGYEFSKNRQLTRVNLSANGLEAGFELFENHPHLSVLDLSSNDVSELCRGKMGPEALLKLNLRNNHIRNLTCLKSEKFRSLCEVDLRDNPLDCGEELDALIWVLANRKGTPYRLSSEVQSDTPQNQCESLSLNGSFTLWNSVKRELCPRGKDLEVAVEAGKEWESSEEESSESPEESLDPRKEEVTREGVEGRRHPVVVLSPGSLEKDQLVRGSSENPQSERLSWEEIDSNPEFGNGFEEEGTPVQARYSWYTIALILIGLSLTLTCFNLVVFLYVRLRVWKKADANAPQKYTILHNEVYRNTTEPSRTGSEGEGEWSPENHARNKMFFFGRMNELLLNFGLQKKEKDSESVQNILIASSANPGPQNC